jgi:hypothetical protein
MKRTVNVKVQGGKVVDVDTTQYKETPAGGKVIDVEWRDVTEEPVLLLEMKKDE